MVAHLAKDFGGQLLCSRIRRQAVVNCSSCHPHGYGSMLSGPFEYLERESIRGLHFPLEISLGPKDLGYPRLKKKKKSIDGLHYDNMLFIENKWLKREFIICFICLNFDERNV